MIAGFQLLIALTGNYCFFNLLTIFLCVLLLDDAFLRRWLPKRLAGYFAGSHLTAARVAEGASAERSKSPLGAAGRVIRAVLAVLILIISGSEMLGTFGLGGAVPSFARQLVYWEAPFDLSNSYGLFAKS